MCEITEWANSRMVDNVVIDKKTYIQHINKISFNKQRYRPPMGQNQPQKKKRKINPINDSNDKQHAIQSQTSNN